MDTFQKLMVAFAVVVVLMLLDMHFGCFSGKPLMHSDHFEVDAGHLAKMLYSQK